MSAEQSAGESTGTFPADGPTELAPAPQQPAGTAPEVRRGPGRPLGTKNGQGRGKARKRLRRPSAPPPAPASAGGPPAATETPAAAPAAKPDAVVLSLATFVGETPAELAGWLCLGESLALAHLEHLPEPLRPTVKALGWTGKDGAPSLRTKTAAELMHPQLKAWAAADVKLSPEVAFAAGLLALTAPALWASLPAIRAFMFNLRPAELPPSPEPERKPQPAALEQAPTPAPDGATPEVPHGP